MTQFNFTTNIEKRMPNTGKVFCIDRMTSDYAEQHPLDVDGFIESVYQEFAGTGFEESREDLHRIWKSVLSVTRPQGDASLYPNKNGAKRAAAMKVWMKAGDYWRRGFRMGDTLPDMVPMTTITRLDGGAWIALFPKDMHLLSEECRVKSEECQRTAGTSAPVVITEPQNDGIEVKPAEPQQRPEPQQLDLFAFEQLKAENERLQEQIERMKAGQEREAAAKPQPTEQAQPVMQPEGNQRRALRKQRKHTVIQSAEHHSHAVAVAAEPKNNNNLLRSLGYLAMASVALLVIWQTGLIIPLGLIGLATSGLIK